MSFTSGMGTYRDAQRQWEDYKRKLLQAATPIGGLPTAKDTMDNGMDTGGTTVTGSTVNHQNQIAQAAQQPLMTPAQSGQTTAITGVPSAASAPGTPPASENLAFLNNDPSKYYYGWDPGSNIMNDPAQANRQYSKFYGYNEGINQILDQFDPMAALQAMGNPLTDFASAQGKLNAIGQFNDVLLGRGNPGGGFFDPRAMIGNIANLRNSFSTGNKDTGRGASSISAGDYIDNPTLQPPDQVKNTVGFMLASLQGVIPTETYQAYANLLQREGLRYIDYRAKDPSSTKNSFLDWLYGNYGEGLGLF